MKITLAGSDRAHACIPALAGTLELKLRAGPTPQTTATPVPSNTPVPTTPTLVPTPAPTVLQACPDGQWGSSPSDGYCYALCGATGEGIYGEYGEGRDAASASHCAPPLTNTPAPVALTTQPITTMGMGTITQLLGAKSILAEMERLMAAAMKILTIKQRMTTTA